MWWYKRLAESFHRMCYSWNKARLMRCVFEDLNPLSPAVLYTTDNKHKSRIESHADNKISVIKWNRYYIPWWRLLRCFRSEMKQWQSRITKIKYIITINFYLLRVNVSHIVRGFLLLHVNYGSDRTRERPEMKPGRIPINRRSITIDFRAHSFFRSCVLRLFDAF